MSCILDIEVERGWRGVNDFIQSAAAPRRSSFSKCGPAVVASNLCKDERTSAASLPKTRLHVMRLTFSPWVTHQPGTGRVRYKKASSTFMSSSIQQQSLVRYRLRLSNCPSRPASSPFEFEILSFSYHHQNAFFSSCHRSRRYWPRQRSASRHPLLLDQLLP